MCEDNMKFPKFEIDEAKVIEIAKLYGVSELYLFGSVLTENFNANSDIDFLISFKNDSEISFLELYELKGKLSKYLQRPVDLIEKEGLTNPFRRENIINTARKLYGN